MFICRLFFSHQAVYSMDCPRTVLIDFLHEDGKFLFRADGMPDLEVNEDDLEMTAENTVVCRLLDNDIKCVAPGRRYDEWFSKFLKGMLPYNLMNVHFHHRRLIKNIRKSGLQYF